MRSRAKSTAALAGCDTSKRHRIEDSAGVAANSFFDGFHRRRLRSAVIFNRCTDDTAGIRDEIRDPENAAMVLTPEFLDLPAGFPPEPDQHFAKRGSTCIWRSMSHHFGLRLRMRAARGIPCES
jgi:hypothetical protein